MCVCVCVYIDTHIYAYIVTIYHYAVCIIVMNLAVVCPVIFLLTNDGLIIHFLNPAVLCQRQRKFYMLTFVF